MKKGHIATFLVLIAVAVSVVLFLKYLQDKKIKDRVYHAGIGSRYYPYEYEENGELKGLSYDLFNDVAKKVGIKIKWEKIPFRNLVSHIEEGKLDIGASTVSIRDDFRERVTFTVPYLTTTTVILGLKGDTHVDHGVYGVIQGRIHEKYANQIEGATVITYTDIELIAKDLENRTINYAIINKNVAKALIENYPDLVMLKEIKTEVNAYIVSNIFNKELLNEINKEIEKAKSDGTVDNLKKKYKIEE